MTLIYLTWRMIDVQSGTALYLLVVPRTIRSALKMLAAVATNVACTVFHSHISK